MCEQHGKRKNSLSLETNSKSIHSLVPVQNGSQSVEGAGKCSWEQGGQQPLAITSAGADLCMRRNFISSVILGEKSPGMEFES